MIDPKTAASIERFFARLEMRVDRALEEATVAGERISAEQADRLLELVSKIFNEMFDRYIERSGKAHPSLPEELRRHFEPWRELLRKRITDRLRPH